MIILVSGMMASSVVYLATLIPTGSQLVLKRMSSNINVYFGKNFGIISSPLRGGRVSLYIRLLSMQILTVALMLSRILILFKPILLIILVKELM